MKAEKNQENGLLIVISAPAGCGKDTILERVLKNNPNMSYSVSATTRTMRSGEIDGVSYHFKTREEFENMLKADKLLEYTEYVGNYYGTIKSQVENSLLDGKDIVLKIEVEGAANIKKIYPDCVTVFILPPSVQELKKRLVKRGTEDEALINRRINKAKIELTFAKNYDYLIINDDLEKAVSDFETIINAEKLAAKRNIKIIGRISRDE